MPRMNKCRLELEQTEQVPTPEYSVPSVSASNSGNGMSSSAKVGIRFFESDNVTVHRAAANDVEYRTRAARGSGATDCYVAYSSYR